jgi:hypothetical protein
MCLFCPDYAVHRRHLAAAIAIGDHESVRAVFIPLMLYRKHCAPFWIQRPGLAHPLVGNRPFATTLNGKMA